MGHLNRRSIPILRRTTSALALTRTHQNALGPPCVVATIDSAPFSAVARGCDVTHRTLSQPATHEAAAGYLFDVDDHRSGADANFLTVSNGLRQASKLLPETLDPSPPYRSIL